MPVQPIDAPAATDAIVGRHAPAQLRQIASLRALTLACVLGLIVLGLVWELWLAPVPGGSGGALALKVLPLTLTISGLLKHKLYTFRALSLLVLLYFAEGVVRATGGDHGWSQWLAFVETLLSVLLFIAVNYYVRLRLKVLPPKA